MKPEDLVEIERIRRLKARYFRLMDAKQWEEWKDVFCEGVVIVTPPAPQIEGRDAFLDFLRPILSDVKTVHHGHMSEIELTGSATATGIWSMEDMLWWPADQGGRRLWGSGWYYEQYRKESDGAWRIARLELRRIRVEIDGKQAFPPE
jgi:ketosteroid isomerase-like protein